MASSKRSPNRRKSIAVTNQNKPAALTRARRRAHSIVPGERLSPLAKARRSLVPRKSILKGSLNLPLPGSQPGGESQSGSLTHTSSPDEGNASTFSNQQSQDSTRDFTAEVHDHPSRKSLSRRVSFASHAHVRVFEKENNTNSTASPQSSPAGPLNAEESNVQSNENAYPGASSSGSRRRSSIRRSVGGEESMDVDEDESALGPEAWIEAAKAPESAIQSEDEDEYEQGSDMELTTAFDRNNRRKSSVAAPPRRPLSIIPSDFHPQHHFSDDQTADFSQSEEDHSIVSSNLSMSQSETDTQDHVARPVEFTHPLSKPLKPPSDAWLALRSMTHAGGEYEDQSLTDDGTDMEITDAVHRLMVARDSLPAGESEQNLNPEESFTSTEGSFNEDPDQDNRTINVSKILGRPSMGGQSNVDSSMDVTRMFGGIVNEPAVAQLTTSSVFVPPSHVQPPTAAAKENAAGPTRTVFQPPPKDVAAPTASQLPVKSIPITSTPSVKASTIPKPFNFSFTPKAAPQPTKPTPGRASPTKSKHPPKFSAAFAPPIARPSPKKRPRPSTDAENEVLIGNHDREDRPSPRKKLAFAPAVADASPSDAEKLPTISIGQDTPTPRTPPVLANRWPTNSPATSAQIPLATTAPQPKRLSPSKKAPFQATLDQPAEKSVSRPSASIRRPSGYFARRKSLGVNQEQQDGATGAMSPKKKTQLVAGRASMGGAGSTITAKFDFSRPFHNEVARDKLIECEREAARQAVAVPSPTRGSPSPAPASPRAGYPMIPTPQDEETVDIGKLLAAGRDVGDVDMDVQDEMDADMSFDPTQQWRDGVQQDGYSDEDGPQISIQQFFNITGIKFMDELTAPRRSTIHPSQLRPRARQNSAGEVHDVPLAEYTTAMAIDVPQLKLYTHVSKDLQAWIDQSKEVFKQAEEEAAKVTPELFREFSMADEEGQNELLHQLTLIKVNTRQRARTEWYDWKLQWVEGLHVTAEKGFAEVESDAKVLEGIIKQAQETVPALEAEYEQIMRELEKEQAEVTEIETGDQDYLNELKASIAEQNIEVEALKAEVSECNVQLQYLQERLEEVEDEKREASNAISEGKRITHLKEHSTIAEVLRLKDELESLEELHKFRATKVNQEFFEYTYDSKIRVSIPCHKFQPIAGRVEISRIDKMRRKFKDAFPQLTDFLLRMAAQRINEVKQLTICQIIQNLGDFWSSCAQLRLQLTLLSIKCPISIELLPTTTSGDAAFKATAVVLYPSVRGKALVSFVFNLDTLSSWPTSISSLRCEVEVAYGPIKQDSILVAVTNRLSQAGPVDSHGCLLDSCIEAMEVY